MAFTARTRAQIRSDLLTAWQARYAANGRTLAAWDGSPAFLLADSLAVCVATIEQQAAAVTRDILPDTAAGSVLDRHGAVWGVSRLTADCATLTVLVTGTALATATMTGKKLVSTTGLLFVADTATVTLGATGNGTITATCTTAGIGGNLASGTVLTWDSTPVDLNPTGTTSGAPVSPGTDTETDAAYQIRIIETLQGRPASGNRADWIAWCEACDGVDTAYIYPLAQPATSPITEGILGCLRLCVMGPAQGDGATNTRILTPARLLTIKGYIEGTHDIHGVVTASGSQLRPVCMSTTDYSIEANVADNVNVNATVVNSAQYAFPWTGSHAVMGATAATVTVAGDQTALQGKPMLVYVGGAVRGNYQYTTPAVAVLDGMGGTKFSSFSPALASTPSVAIYPGPP